MLKVREIYQNSQIIERIETEQSPEDEYQEGLTQAFNDIHEQAILALKHWSSLTLVQKDTLLKNLIKWALWKDSWLKLGVLD